MGSVRLIIVIIIFFSFIIIILLLLLLLFILLLLLFIIDPFRELSVPCSGKATTAARAGIPSPTLVMYAVFTYCNLQIPRLFYCECHANLSIVYHINYFHASTASSYKKRKKEKKKKQKLKHPITKWSYHTI